MRSHRLRLSPTGTSWRSSGYDSELPMQGVGVDPCWETKIPHASQLGQKTEKKKKKGLVLQHCPPLSLLQMSIANPSCHLCLTDGAINCTFPHSHDSSGLMELARVAHRTHEISYLHY